jgi:cytochrome P450
LGRDTLTSEWVADHFDHLSPELAQNLHPTLAKARQVCPVAHSDQHGGFWVASHYEDVLAVAQDWETWSSELGITVPNQELPADMKIMPVSVDPPLQRTFKRLINAYFTPKAVAPWEEPTRALVNRLIDGFADAGRCDFMKSFARPFPGLAFFDLALHAPATNLAEVNDWATAASLTHLPESRDSMLKLAGWIAEFITTRRETGPRGDVVDAVLDADIEGRPITVPEAIGTIQLLILGGLETTAGALGMTMQRFCAHPEIPELLRAQPERIPDAVEELLRLDGSFICIGRTARHDTEVGGKSIKAGERIIIYWASANRDQAEFERPDEFVIDRTRNRHIVFGAGPHRCAGSNLARLNLRVALEEVTRRLAAFKLDLAPGERVEYHSTFNRAPENVPITFDVLQ